MTEQKESQNQKAIKAVDVKTFFVDLFKDFIDLDKGVDKWGTIREIKSKQSMSGANAWMLMCSIMIASIGLNLNSQAVIIGAMLISPLMSPILGIGLGVAINDKDALSHALMHFGAAIIIALLTSTFYFWLTPMDAFTQEIEARTAPTFLDILIAIFGGIAGIVSLSRKDISTTIPGVAIATALMPPLCVAGFGLANGRIDIASKAFYLFFLNSFFVAFATYVILRQMRFPFKEYSSPTDRRKNMAMVTLFSIIMIIPSVLIFKNVYSTYKEGEKVKQFIKKSIGENEIYIDSYTLFKKPDGSKNLLLKVYGDAISKRNISKYQSDLTAIGLQDVNLEIIPTSEIEIEKVHEIEMQLSQVGDKLNTQINQLKNERDQRQELIESLKNDSDILLRDSLKFEEACEELTIFIPELKEIGMANVQYIREDSIYHRIPTAIVSWHSKNSDAEEKLKKYLIKHFKLDSLRVVNN